MCCYQPVNQNNVLLSTCQFKKCDSRNGKTVKVVQVVVGVAVGVLLELVKLFNGRVSENKWIQISLIGPIQISANWGLIKETRL